MAVCQEYMTNSRLVGGRLMKSENSGVYSDDVVDYERSGVLRLTIAIRRAKKFDAQGPRPIWDNPAAAGWGIYLLMPVNSDTALNYFSTT